MDPPSSGSEDQKKESGNTPLKLSVVPRKKLSKVCLIFPFYCFRNQLTIFLTSISLMFLPFL